MDKLDEFDIQNIRVETIRKVIELLKQQKCTCFWCTDDDWSTDHIGNPIEIDTCKFETELRKFLVSWHKNDLKKESDENG